MEKLTFILQNCNENSIIDFITIGTAVATFIALGFSIFQSMLARRSLDAAKLAINEDTKARQISMIPDMHYIILVQLSLEKWKKELSRFKEMTRKAISDKDEEILKTIASEAPSAPSDVMTYVDAYTYEKMPDSLKAIVMSGAQHFYNAAGTVRSMYEGGKAQWTLTDMMDNRFDESIYAVDELYNLINQMIPSVLLDTPQSIQNSRFLK